MSNKMKDTVVVEVERLVSHPIYRKRIRRTNRLHAHDEMSSGRGDIVKIVETKPYAKTVTWKVIEIIKRYATA